MAAAYLFHIVQDHPFVDGNKRTGVTAALAFLALNGLILNAHGNELEVLVRKVAEGTASKEDVAGFVIRHVRR